MYIKLNDIQKVHFEGNQLQQIVQLLIVYH